MRQRNSCLPKRQILRNPKVRVAKRAPQVRVLRAARRPEKQAIGSPCRGKVQEAPLRSQKPRRYRVVRQHFAQSIGPCAGRQQHKKPLDCGGCWSRETPPETSTSTRCPNAQQGSDHQKKRSRCRSRSKPKRAAPLALAPRVFHWIPDSPNSTGRGRRLKRARIGVCTKSSNRVFEWAGAIGYPMCGTLRTCPCGKAPCFACPKPPGWKGSGSPKRNEFPDRSGRRYSSCSMLFHRCWNAIFFDHPALPDPLNRFYSRCWVLRQRSVGSPCYRAGAAEPT